jgi:hypothetical protein
MNQIVRKLSVRIYLSTEIQASRHQTQVQQC